MLSQGALLPTPSPGFLFFSLCSPSPLLSLLFSPQHPLSTVSLEMILSPPGCLLLPSLSPLFSVTPSVSSSCQDPQQPQSPMPTPGQRGAQPGAGGESEVGQVMGHAWDCTIHTRPRALPSPPPEGASPSPVLPGCPTPTSPAGTCCVLAKCWDQDWDVSEGQIPAQIHCPPWSGLGASGQCLTQSAALESAQSWV